MVILLKKFYCVKAPLNINHPTNLSSLHSFLLLILLLLSHKIHVWHVIYIIVEHKCLNLRLKRLHVAKGQVFAQHFKGLILCPTADSRLFVCSRASAHTVTVSWLANALLANWLDATVTVWAPPNCMWIVALTTSAVVQRINPLFIRPNGLYILLALYSRRRILFAVTSGTFSWRGVVGKAAISK